MLAEVLILLVRCCVATVVIEVAGAFLLFRVRSKQDLIVVVLTQVVTNPLVEACTITAFAYLAHPWVAVAVLELCAFMAEALIYRAKCTTERPWLMSGLLNVLSFSIGLLFL